MKAMKNLLLLACILFVGTVYAQKKSINKVSMHRTACFGKCPTYSLEINKNGSVTYTSIRFTKFEGIYTKKFSIDKVKNIFLQVNLLKLDTCQNEYEQIIADLPGLNFNIDYTNAKKQIVNAHFGPKFLKRLAMNIDKEFSIDSTWKKIK
jgi:hypothetical protein